MESIIKTCDRLEAIKIKVAHIDGKLSKIALELWKRDLERHVTILEDIVNDWSKGLYEKHGR